MNRIPYSDGDLPGKHLFLWLNFSQGEKKHIVFSWRNEQLAFHKDLPWTKIVNLNPQEVCCGLFFRIWSHEILTVRSLSDFSTTALVPYTLFSFLSSRRTVIATITMVNLFLSYFSRKSMMVVSFVHHFFECIQPKNQPYSVGLALQLDYFILNRRKISL